MFTTLGLKVIGKDQIAIKCGCAWVTGLQCLRGCLFSFKKLENS